MNENLGCVLVVAIIAVVFVVSYWLELAYGVH